MTTPLHFPRQADVIREQAEAFRRLSPAERTGYILDLIACGEMILQVSPNRKASLRLHDAHKNEWRKIQKELFQRHEQRCRQSIPESASRGSGTRESV